LLRKKRRTKRRILVDFDRRKLQGILEQLVESRKVELSRNFGVSRVKILE
jgi:hypothetical protein